MSDRTAAYEAVRSFSRARRRASLLSLLRAFGRSDDSLLAYEDVRRRLHAVEGSAPVLEDVPIEAIVGSVGRYNDFTREFLPKVDSDQERWVGVRLAMSGQAGTPPVELYRIGEAYFVRDGNHRVSVARQLGARTIQAYVTPVHARVPLSAETRPDDVILAAEQARFLEETAVDELRPGADVRLTAPGGYSALREHIAVHRYYMGLEQGREVGEAEAVAHWYDEVYRSVVDAIHAAGVMREFPGRTETDLYLWLSHHRGRLATDLGFEMRSESIAEHLNQPPRLTPALRDEVLESVRHGRRERRARESVLIDDVLVVTGRGAAGRLAVEQAIVVARREGARLHALYPEAASPHGGDDEEVAELRASFEAACAEAGVEAQFARATGPAGAEVLERVPWFDLVVLPLVEAGANGAPRISAAYGPVLRRSVRPILAVHGRATTISRALVAFDGGSKSEEALFAAAYLASKWGTSLVIITVVERSRSAESTLDEARRYLERFELEADFVGKRGPVARTLVEVAEERECDLVVMGSYRYSRLLETVVGGVVVRTLLQSPGPVLIV